jgi:hypothetical protein
LLPSKQLIENVASAEDIAFLAVLFASLLENVEEVDFGGCIHRSAPAIGAELILFCFLGSTKICDFYLVFIVQQQIVRLDVPVKDF